MMMNKKPVFYLLILILVLTSIPVFSQSGARGRRNESTEYELTVRSNVPSARIYIDSTFRGNPPLRVRITEGVHTVRVAAPGYLEQVKTLNVTKDFTVDINLLPAASVVTVRSNVRGANVYVDEEYQGKTPLELEMSPGTYSVIVTALDYANEEKIFIVDQNRSYNNDPDKTVIINGNSVVDIFLEPESYSLNIRTNVPNAVVYIDGRLMGPLAIIRNLLKGTYTVTITAPGYQDYVTSVEITQNSSLRADLLPAVATLNIIIPESLLYNRIGNPENKIFIYVDDDRVNLKNGMPMVNPGEHTIRIVSGGMELSRVFFFEPGITYEIQPFAGIMIDDDLGF